MSEHLTLTVRDIKKLTNDVITVTFTKPPDFRYIAGQFVQFAIKKEEALTYRSYSLSSAPDEAELECCVKLLPEGVGSNYFRTLKPGSTAEIRGPQGKFIVNGGADGHYFIATGVGIAPIMSMVRDEIETKKTDKEIRLLFGVRSEEDLFWTERFEALKKISSNFSYQIVLSQPKANNKWPGLKGRVTEHLLHHLINHDAYLCGSAAMVKDVRELFLKNGMPVKQIHFEIF